MVETPPAPAFIVVQAQVILAPLKVLLNRPAPAAQSQHSPFGRRLLEPGNVNVVRIGLARRPVRDQPAMGPLPIVLIQITVKANLPPSQSRCPFLAVGGLPSRRLPLSRLKSLGQLAQGLAFGRLFAHAPVLWALRQFGALGPSQPRFLAIEKVFQPEPTN